MPRCQQEALTFIVAMFLNMNDLVDTTEIELSGLILKTGQANGIIPYKILGVGIWHVKLGTVVTQSVQEEDP